MLKPHSAKSIANLFLKFGLHDGAELDLQKIQSLVFFAHGYCLALILGPLVDEAFEAFPEGPSLPSLDREFKNSGAGALQHSVTTDSASLIPTDEGVVDMVEFIWRKYGPMETTQLRALTRVTEGAWEVHRAGDRVIDDALIEAEFAHSMDDDWLLD